MASWSHPGVGCPICHDLITKSGADYCDDCLREIVADRLARVAKVEAETAKHEADVIGQDSSLSVSGGAPPKAPADSPAPGADLAARAGTGTHSHHERTA